jgi:ABC-type bacteriocin/lantibiotic exporter with double-glycine peptidase domain
VVLINTPAASLLNSYPSAIAALGCLKRIQDFLESEEFHDRRSRLDEPGSTEKLFIEGTFDDKMPSVKSSNVVLSVSNLALKPEMHSDGVQSLINFTMSRATITMILGPLGSGKTTILKAILGESRLNNGTIGVNSPYMAYCAQNPWLQSGTIRDNITAPSIFDEENYRKVLWLCVLDEDIEQMPDKDLSEVGSRVLALSGGQRHRIVSLLTIFSVLATLIVLF